MKVERKSSNFSTSSVMEHSNPTTFTYSRARWKVCVIHHHSRRRSWLKRPWPSCKSIWASISRHLTLGRRLHLRNQVNAPSKFSKSQVAPKNGLTCMVKLCSFPTQRLLWDFSLTKIADKTSTIKDTVVNSLSPTILLAWRLRKSSSSWVVLRTMQTRLKRQLDVSEPLWNTKMVVINNNLLISISSSNTCSRLLMILAPTRNTSHSWVCWEFRSACRLIKTMLRLT